MTLYKLTRPDDCTGGTDLGTRKLQWGEGVAHQAHGPYPVLCSSGVIHAYRHPLVAIMMDPAHVGFGPTAHLWEVEGEVVDDDGTKVGCRSLTTVRRIELPTLTATQRVTVALRVALAIGMYSEWSQWAFAWLGGKHGTAAEATRLGSVLPEGRPEKAASFSAAAWVASQQNDRDELGREAVQWAALALERVTDLRESQRSCLTALVPLLLASTQ